MEMLFALLFLLFLAATVSNMPSQQDERHIAKPQIAIFKDSLEMKKAA